MSLHRTWSAVLLAAILTSTATLAGADESPLPLLDLWESNMRTFGRQVCDKLAPGADTFSSQLDSVYYDGQRVYYQIAAYTGDPTWKYCADRAEALFRDGYVMPNSGKVAGWMNFTGGLLTDYQLTGDTTSQNAVVLMSQYAAFAQDGTPLDWTADASSSREVAYAIMSYLNAEAAGQPRRARLADMVNQALGHIDQWFVSKTASYVRPFMVGITMQALIQAYHATQDERIPSAIKTAVDSLWATTWLPDAKAFKYTNMDTSRLDPSAFGYNTGGTDPAADLNLLIVPAYGWMYYRTGDTTYRDQGDQIFAGGVANAHTWLYLGKQFDQSYWWSPAYVSWRRAAIPQTPQSTNSTATPSTSNSTASTPTSPTSPTNVTTSTPSTGPTSITPATEPSSATEGHPRGMYKKKRR